MAGCPSAGPGGDDVDEKTKSDWTYAEQIHVVKWLPDVQRLSADWPRLRLRMTTTGIVFDFGERQVVVPRCLIPDPPPEEDDGYHG